MEKKELILDDNKQIKNFKIGCIWNGKLYEMIIEANYFHESQLGLSFYLKKDEKTPQTMVASFLHVVYIWNLGPILKPEDIKPSIAKEDKKEEPKEKSFAEMMDELSEIAKPGELPEGWGKVNGKVF